MTNQVLFHVKSFFGFQGGQSPGISIADFLALISTAVAAIEQTIVRYLLIGFAVIVLLNLYWNLVFHIVELLTKVSKMKFLPEKLKLGTTLVGNAIISPYLSYALQLAEEDTTRLSTRDHDEKHFNRLVKWLDEMNANLRNASNVNITFSVICQLVRVMLPVEECKMARGQTVEMKKNVVAYGKRWMLLAVGAVLLSALGALSFGNGLIVGVATALVVAGAHVLAAEQLKRLDDLFVSLGKKFERLRDAVDELGAVSRDLNTVVVRCQDLVDRTRPTFVAFARGADDREPKALFDQLNCLSLRGRSLCQHIETAMKRVDEVKYVAFDDL